MGTSYCIFEINQRLSAINSDYLEEVIALPELIPIPNAPSGIVGVFDLHGNVLPVVDLRQNRDEQPQQYLLSDSIIILKQSGLRVGMIANNIQDIRKLSTQGMLVDLSGHQTWMNPDTTDFFDGMILNEADILVLREPQTWFNSGEIEQIIAVTRFLVDDFYESRTAQTEGGLSETNLTTLFSPDSTSQEKTIFRQRADNLRRPLNPNQAVTDSKMFIVVALDDQLLGIEANAVREFITLTQATPIPCCPRYIVGSTSLRGEVLTVMDISEPLGFPSKKLAKNPKAVVVELGNTLAAIVIKEVRDALFEVTTNSIQTDVTFSTSYVQGTVPYGEQMMQVLDLPKLLRSDDLVINETL